MGRRDGRLVIRIVGDARSFNNSMNRTSRRVQGFGDDMRRIGGQAAAAAGAFAVAFAVEAVQAASALEQSVGAVQTVFGEASSAISEFAETSAQSFGLSARAANEMAARVGASLIGMGFDAATAADLAVRLEQRGADLAATFGGDVSEAVDAIGSLLRGERDPIERYGVSIKQADINARLAAEGLSDLEGEAKKQAEAQAALTLLFEQTASSAGAFAREEDTFAGASARFQAALEDLQAQVGEDLLPVLTDLTTWMTETLPVAVDIGEAVIGTFVGAVQGLARSAADAVTQTEQLFSSFGQGAESAAFTGLGDLFPDRGAKTGTFVPPGTDVTSYPGASDINITINNPQPSAAKEDVVEGARIAGYLVGT